MTRICLRCQMPFTVKPLWHQKFGSTAEGPVYSRQAYCSAKCRRMASRERTKERGR